MKASEVTRSGAIRVRMKRERDVKYMKGVLMIRICNTQRTSANQVTLQQDVQHNHEWHEGTEREKKVRLYFKVFFFFFLSVVALLITE